MLKYPTPTMHQYAEPIAPRERAVNEDDRKINEFIQRGLMKQCTTPMVNVILAQLARPIARGEIIAFPKLAQANA